MADAQVKDEAALVDFEGDEITYMVDDPGGTPSDKKAEVRYWGMPFGTPRRRFYTFNDCLTPGAMAAEHWAHILAGTGANINSVNLTTLNALGILQLGLGTTNAGRAAIMAMPVNAASACNAILFGKGRARFQAKAAIHVLSDGTDTYSTQIGFQEGLSSGGADGCYFRYTHSVAGGNWQAVSRNNNTETATATDTGVAVVADAWKLFYIQVNSAGTEATFYIDGALVATHTANIPTGSGRETTYGAMAFKSAGTTDTNALYVDFLEVEYVFTTPR